MGQWTLQIQKVNRESVNVCRTNSKGTGDYIDRNQAKPMKTGISNGACFPPSAPGAVAVEG